MIIPEDEIQKIAPLAKIQKVRPMSSGINSNTYILYTPDDQYVLTVLHDEKENSDLKLITESNSFLVKNGFPIPQILSQGKILGKAAFLTNYLRGKVNHPLSLDDYNQIGFFLGSLHLTTENYDSEVMTLPLIIRIKREFTEIEKQIPPEFRSLSTYLEEIEESWPTRLPKGLIHGDIRHKSLLFDQAKICALLDYFEPSIDLLIYDLGSILKKIYFSDQEESTKECFDALISGYELSRPLSQDERSALPLMLKTKLLHTVLFFLKKGEEFPSQKYDHYSIAYLNFMKLEEMFSHLQKWVF